MYKSGNSKVHNIFNYNVCCLNCFGYFNQLFTFPCKYLVFIIMHFYIDFESIIVKISIFYNAIKFNLLNKAIFLSSHIFILNFQLLIHLSHFPIFSDLLNYLACHLKSSQHEKSLSESKTLNSHLLSREVLLVKSQIELWRKTSKVLRKRKAIFYSHFMVKGFLTLFDVIFFSQIA